MVEFMVTGVKPVWGLYRKAWWSLKKIKGFEYVEVEVIWAFEDQPNQKEYEVHPNDLVLLNDNSMWVVTGRSGDTLMLRLLNASKYGFKRLGNPLHGEATTVGNVNYK